MIDRAGCKEGGATLKGVQGDVFSFTYSQDVMAGPSRCCHSLPPCFQQDTPDDDLYQCLMMMLCVNICQVHLALWTLGGGNVYDGGETGKGC